VGGEDSSHWLYNRWDTLEGCHFNPKLGIVRNGKKRQNELYYPPLMLISWIHIHRLYMKGEVVNLEVLTAG